MGTTGTVLVGLAILVGVVGAVVQVIPSAIIIIGALLVWAIAWNTATAWIIFTLAALVLVLAAVVKYLVPAKKLSGSDIPRSTLVAGVAGGVVGWFVGLPVGLVLGFIATIYVLEWRRLRAADAAWASTLAALRAVGLSILIEVVAALTAATIWGVGLLLV
ncbi:DUF456 domain-containing protein [Actinomyces sp. B33]|uniref:DUF456 domain-containing protein n=1 Tax=Actinomyces sp. B33 TaxID=2942131 RepID=UPI00234005F3|nr:DUF456 domain-containing protein [Actinomyces sp. B33]MDC4233663.1 DUF456 domain-containing protein [Actinomyces sp. B33]